jgi:hypothetical protein
VIVCRLSIGSIEPLVVFFAEFGSPYPSAAGCVNYGHQTPWLGERVFAYVSFCSSHFTPGRSTSDLYGGILPKYSGIHDRRISCPQACFFNHVGTSHHIAVPHSSQLWPWRYILVYRLATKIMANILDNSSNESCSNSLRLRGPGALKIIAAARVPRPGVFSGSSTFTG